jgi:hypothetical protein
MEIFASFVLLALILLVALKVNELDEKIKKLERSISLLKR